MIVALHSLVSPPGPTRRFFDDRIVDNTPCTYEKTGNGKLTVNPRPYECHELTP
jgi:hypothetical protein